jgi:holin-like protein
MPLSTESTAEVAAAYDQTVPARDRAGGRRAAARAARWLPLAALQIVGLWGLNSAGVWFVEKTALPIPGNLVGMVALYALLAFGIVKLAWFEAAGSFLIRHLAFFFVPITVGLMDAGGLFATHGFAILFILAASAGIGILLAGWVSQFLLRKSWRRSPLLEDES